MSENLPAAPTGERLHSPQDSNLMTRYLVAATLAVGLTASLANGSEGVTAAEQVAPQSVEIHTPFSPLATCPEVNAQTLITVERLLQRPEHPAIATYTADEVNKKGPTSIFMRFTGQALPVDMQRRINTKVQIDVANELGLTIHDPLPIIEKMYARIDERNPLRPPSPSFNDYFKAAQDFAAKYDVDLRLAAADDTSLSDAGFLPPRLEAYESDHVKEGMIGIIEGLGTLPEEYVRGAGLKNITLYDGQVAKWGGLAFQGGGKIALPIGNRISPLTIKHEIAHLFDHISCGTSSVDPQIEAVGNSTIDSSDVIILNQPYYQQRAVALRARDTAEVCRLTRKIDENEILIGAFTSYGKTSRAENIAEGVSSFGSSTHYGNVLAPGRSPRLKALTLLLYGRIHAMSPEIAEFFANTTPHIAPEDLFTTACATGNWQRLVGTSGSK